MNNLNYLMDLILYHIFRTISNKSSRSIKHWQVKHQFEYMSTNFRIEYYSRLKS